MKKILTLLLLCILIGLFGCSPKHEHSWKEANCEESKTCTECGETEGEALGHEWAEATCTTPKTCLRCGKTEGEALGHSVKNLSCTEGGTCERCGKEIEPLGHITPNLSCTEGDTCQRCGEVFEPLGHEEGEAVKKTISSATCTEVGSYKIVVYCTRCNDELSSQEYVEEALGHTTTSGVCSRCKKEVYEPITGSGDDVVSNISLGDSFYKAHITNSGRSNFAIWCYDKNDDRDLLVNEIGNYDGYVLLLGASPLTMEVTSSGNWKIEIEALGQTTNEEFSGSGDYVTDIFSGTKGTYRFTHDGKSNFAVWVYTADGRDLLVNEIGKYDGKKIVRMPSGSKCFFEITADGDWTIEKAD